MSEHPPIPGYELLRLLARNGHLSYLARQSSNGFLVHLHVANGSGDFGRLVADRLRQQAAILGTLDHPNILQSLEVGQAKDYGFFSALEYAGGGCLDDKLCAGAVSVPAAVSLARDIANALQYARKHDVSAHDLTPRSILLTEDGRVKLSEFRPLSEDRGGMFKAFTPRYAAPEEVMDSENGQRSTATDVYRVGAVLYALLSGEPPCGRGRDVNETLRHVLEHPPAPIRQTNKAVPTDVEAVCLRCLEKSPMLRYADPSDLVDIFNQLLTVTSDGQSQTG